MSKLTTCRVVKSFDCNRLLGSHHSSPLRTDRDNIAASTAGITTGSFAYASHSSCCNATRYLTKAPNNAAPTISGDAVKRCCRCSNISTCPNSSTSVPASSGLIGSRSERLGRGCRSLKRCCNLVRALLSLLRQITLAEECGRKQVRARIQSLTQKPLQ